MRRNGANAARYPPTTSADLRIPKKLPRPAPGDYHNTVSLGLDTDVAMSDQPSPGRKLRDAWAAETIAVPGVFSPLVAKLAERIGFRAVYLSGGALSAASGVPDIGLLTLTEFVAQAQLTAQATALPLLCDADTGFGEALNVERTIRMYESAGAAGVHLEDQKMPKRCGHLSGKSLVEPEEMAAKIRAACAARRDRDFVVIARTDARGVTGFDDAVKRARLCLEAGADAIFPEALETPDEFARFAKAVPCPLLANMTEFGKSPNLSVKQLGELGYRMVLFPLTAFRVAMRAAEETLAELFRAGTQGASTPKMMTRAELYDLLGYTGYEERDRRYFGGTRIGMRDEG
jgi:methylisocitrate lyase